MNLPSTTEPRTFKDLIQSEKYRSGIAKALPAGVTADRVEKLVISMLNKKPELLACTALSLYNACIECATLNLWPGPQGHMYFIPRNNKVRGSDGRDHYELQADAMIGWRGMVEMAYRSCQIVPGSFIGQTIHENDHLEYEYGSNQRIVHRPKLGSRGDIIGAWVGCIPKDGALVFHVMDVDEIEAIRARSKTPNAGPWKTDYAEMCCKTVIRRLWKYLPSSVADKFAEALEKDAEREFDLKHVTGVVTGGGRFTKDEADPPAEEKSEGKAALDAATQEADRREAEKAPTFTHKEVIALAHSLDDNELGRVLDALEIEKISTAPADRLAEIHAALIKAGAK